MAKRKGFARRIIGAFTDLGLRTQILCCATIPLIVIVTVAILGLRGLEEVYSGSQMLDRSHETVQGLLGVEAHALAHDPNRLTALEAAKIRVDLRERHLGAWLFAGA